MLQDCKFGKSWRASDRSSMPPRATTAGTKKTYTLKQACCQGYPESTICVQVPVGSRNSAIHNAYRTSLRPSSLIEPRHPSLKVVNKVTSWCTIVFERIASTPRQQERRWYRSHQRPTTLGHLHEGMRHPHTNPNKTIHMVLSKTCEWSFRRFTYGNLVTTSPSSKW